MCQVGLGRIGSDRVGSGRVASGRVGSGRVEDVLPRTNNSVEGWHRAFHSSLSCAHPSLWKFIKQIRKEEALQHFNITQTMNGVSVAGRKKYRCCDARIRNLVQRYATMNTMEFIRAIAHNSLTALYCIICF